MGKKILRDLGKLVLRISLPMLFAFNSYGQDKSKKLPYRDYNKKGKVILDVRKEVKTEFIYRGDTLLIEKKIFYGQNRDRKKTFLYEHTDYGYLKKLKIFEQGKLVAISLYDFDSKQNLIRETNLFYDKKGRMDRDKTEIIPHP